MNALAINGSPRKNGNTATLLNKTLEGTASQGCETELIHLYDLNFKGCDGCNRCKLINGKSNGKCAQNDELSPILKKVYETDILILGSPVYLGAATGELRCFMERLIYPRLMSKSQKNILTGFIYTMAANETQAKERGIINCLRIIETPMKFARLETIESLFVHNAIQFAEVSKYFSKISDPSHFKEFEEKIKLYNEEFPITCEKAFNMGKKLAKV